MIAPKRLRVIVDRNGNPVDALDAQRFGLAPVRKRRTELARADPDRAPFAIVTYQRETQGPVITLPPKGKKP